MNIFEEYFIDIYINKIKLQMNFSKKGINNTIFYLLQNIGNERNNNKKKGKEENSNFFFWLYTF